MTDQNSKQKNPGFIPKASSSSHDPAVNSCLTTSYPLTPSDLKALRANTTSEEVSSKLISLPKICKPGRQTWFQTHPDEVLWEPYHLFTPEGELGVIYVVAPHVANILGSLAPRHRLIPTINLEGEVNFWPLKIPERPNSWSECALEIAGAARTDWRRMAPNTRVGAYDAYGMKTAKPSPEWPTPDEINALLERAVGSRIITSEDHPEVTKLF